MAHTFLTKIPCSSSTVQVSEHSFLAQCEIRDGLRHFEQQLLHWYNLIPAKKRVTVIRESLTQLSIISMYQDFLIIFACQWSIHETWNIHGNALHCDTLTRILMSYVIFPFPNCIP